MFYEKWFIFLKILMSKQTKLSYNLQLKLSIIVMLIFSFSYIATKNRKIS